MTQKTMKIKECLPGAIQMQRAQAFFQSKLEVLPDAVHKKGTGKIIGLQVMTKGRLADISGDARDWEVDDTTLDQLATLGDGIKNGVKARFGHPGMSASALGKFLGRVWNFRRDPIDGVTRADLFLDSTAYNTPNGNLAQYVLDLAESDPAAFGTSIVFDADLEFRLEPDGTRQKDSNGESLPGLLRITRLFADDVVDDPAANKGMFSYTDSVQLSADATALLDTVAADPKTRKLLEKVINEQMLDGADIPAFLKRYLANQNHKTKGKPMADEEKKELENVDGLDSDQVDPEPAPIETEPEPTPEPETEPEPTPEPEETEKVDQESFDNGFKNGVEVERARILEIQGEAKALTKGRNINLDAISEKLIAAGTDVSLAVDDMKNAALDALTDGAPASPGPNDSDEYEIGKDVDEMDQYQFEKHLEQTWDKNAKVRREYGNDKNAFIAFEKADRVGLIKGIRK